jgi:hypothetical protein
MNKNLTFYFRCNMTLFLGVLLLIYPDITALRSLVGVVTGTPIGFSTDTPSEIPLGGNLLSCQTPLIKGDQNDC